MHAKEGSRYCDVHGREIILEDDLTKLLTPLHADLIPILPLAESSLELLESSTAKTTPAGVVLTLTDAADCRPPGTLAGGVWYEYITTSKEQDETTKTQSNKVLQKQVQLLYCERDSNGERFYTREGVQVHPKTTTNLNGDEKGEGVGQYSYKLVSITQGAAVSLQTCAAQQKASQSNINSNSHNSNQQYNTGPQLAKGPPGMPSGGKWYKQRYSGPRTQDQAVMMCCIAGLYPAMVISGSRLDERFVYRYANHYRDIHGHRVIPSEGGPLEPLPNGVYPLGTATGVHYS